MITFLQSLRLVFARFEEQHLDLLNIEDLGGLGSNVLSTGETLSVHACGILKKPDAGDESSEEPCAVSDGVVEVIQRETDCILEQKCERSLHVLGSICGNLVGQDQQLASQVTYLDLSLTSLLSPKVFSQRRLLEHRT